MISSQAQTNLAEALAPFSYNDFFDKIVERQPLALVNNEGSNRHLMLGSDPKNIILSHYDKHAPNLTYHAHSPTGPVPSPRAVSSSQEFQGLVTEFHEHGYTVRIPEVEAISDELQIFIRSLEVIIEKPVSAMIFWSAAGARAPIHHDNHDLLCIQLAGHKRWFISQDEAELSNPWKTLGEGVPSFDRYDTVDIGPGDLIYMPRGTAHTVQSTSESIHLSIGFVPVTVRDAINAALDHLSDLDRPLRASVTKRADALSKGQEADTVSAHIIEGLEKLISQCQSSHFIDAAMKRRKARMIKELPKLQAVKASENLTVKSTINHTALGFADYIPASNNLDISLPGENVLVHLGAKESIAFIMETPEFLISDIPGIIGDDVRIALVQRLMNSGFLELSD